MCHPRALVEHQFSLYTPWLPWQRVRHSKLHNSDYQEGRHRPEIFPGTQL